MTRVCLAAAYLTVGALMIRPFAHFNEEPLEMWETALLVCLWGPMVLLTAAAGLFIAGAWYVRFLWRWTWTR